MLRYIGATVALGLILLSSTLHAQTQETDSDATQDILDHRKKQEADFRNPEESPLDKKDFKKFKGLHYYPIDLKYRVMAKFTKSESATFFKMKTSTDRLPDYSIYGTLEFELDGQRYTLEVYQSPDIIKRPGYSDYLFVPFTDTTNGNETYEVGRYLELRIAPDATTADVVLDFNKAYNPYCSYSGRYSCPIPPEANDLPIAITAGEKKYKSHH